MWVNGRYYKYVSKIGIGHTKIRSYSGAGLRYPDTTGNKTVLRSQYWAGRLGLVAFAHNQLHKSKRGKSRWAKLGLNDTH